MAQGSHIRLQLKAARLLRASLPEAIVVTEWSRESVKMPQKKHIPSTDFTAAADRAKQKRWRSLQDDEIEKIFSELVKAKVAEIVGCASTNTQVSGVGRAPVSQTSDVKVEAEDWKWLDKLVQRQLKEAIDSKRDDTFVLLTPQGYVDWWNSLFQAVIAISLLGAGFTFTIIFSDITAPYGDEGKVQHVRTCLIASWMLFVMSVAWASFASVILAVNKTHVLNALASGKKWYKSIVLFGITVAVLVQMVMPVGAFLAAAEAVRMYHNGFGIATLAMVGLIGLLMIIGWALQNCVFSGPGKLKGRLERSERWRRRFGVIRETPDHA